MFRDVFVHEADDKTNNVTCIQVETGHCFTELNKTYNHFIIQVWLHVLYVCCGCVRALKSHGIS